MSTGGWVGIIIAVAILMGLIGGFVGFIITKKLFEKQLKENPPITRNQIKAMFAQMGRKASEAQINSVMRAMQNAKD